MNQTVIERHFDVGFRKMLHQHVQELNMIGYYLAFHQNRKNVSLMMSSHQSSSRVAVHLRAFCAVHRLSHFSGWAQHIVNRWRDKVSIHSAQTLKSI